MSKLIKLVLILILALILLLVAAVVAAGMFIDKAAKAGIEKGATYALGVPTTLASADVGIFGGTFEMSGLRVSNPAGFKEDKFLSLGGGRLAVSLGSLMQDVIHVPELTLDSIDVNLERREGTANYKVIMDNLAKLGGKGKQPKPAPSEGKEKKFIINKLTIRKVNVKADLAGVGGQLGGVLNKAASVTVPIEEIKLKDVGKTGTGVAGTGVTVEELSSIIVQAVLGAAAENGGGILPADLLVDLKGQLASVDGLKGLGVEVMGKLGESAQQLGEQIQGDVTKKVEEAAKKIEEAVGGGLRDILSKPK